MPYSAQFEIGRAKSSRAGQKATGAVKIGDMTIEYWDGRLLAIDANVKAESAARISLQGATAIWGGHLRDVYDSTRHAAVLSKKRFQNEPAKLALFANIKPSDNSRALICKMGTDLVPAWEKADPTWAPVDNATLPVLKALLKQCGETDEPDHRDKLALWRVAAAELNAAADLLHNDNVVWYASATRQFPEGTPFGDMIRSTVPVTTDTVEEVGQAVIKNLLVVGSTARFDIEAAHATSFTSLHLKPGATAWVTLQADTPEAAVTVGGLTPGEHRFKGLGANSQGLGPESAEAVVTIAAPEVAPQPAANVAQQTARSRIFLP